MDFSGRIDDKHNYEISVISEYTGMRNKIKLKCNVCNHIYETTAKTALVSGCPKCSTSSKRNTLDNFIVKSKKFHGDLYDYSLVEYTNNNTPVKIKCKIHGIFTQTPSVHYRSGCPFCFKENKKLTTKSFIEKSIKLHGKKYDYNETNYSSYTSPIKIKCKIHGVFTQTPASHLQGYGCKLCGYEKNKINVGELTQQLKSLYPQFILDDIEYTNSQSNITLTCPTHGGFSIKPPKALQGDAKCPVCRSEALVDKQLHKFIQKSKSIHKSKYTYNKSIYTKYKNNIKITCPKHGVFNQIVLNHLQGKGCNKCALESTTSKPQQELLDFIKLYINECDIVENSNILDGKHIDILLPKLNIGFEMNGIYWHSENGGNPKNKNYHLNKTKIASSKNIQLLHIQDSEWYQKRNKLESLIKAKFNKFETRVYGRNCIIKDLPIDVYNDFCVDNHLQDSATASIRYGLFHNDTLVSVMSFSRSRFTKHTWEMIRYCCKLNTTIIGGSKKLFKHFTRSHTGSIVSYSDRRFFDGKMYESLGFINTHNSPPNYFYFKGYNVNTVTMQNRVSYQKHKLASKLERFDNKLTEAQNMFNHGFDRIWDSGNKVWVYK